MALAEPTDWPATDGMDYDTAVCTTVEWLFSDESLPHDSFMLGLTAGSQNWPVNISRLTGFPLMRQYKPWKKVRDALKKSDRLELVNNTHVKRRIPLAASIKPTVEPDLIPGKNAPALPKGVKTSATHVVKDGAAPLFSSKVPDPDKPWITKGLLKPTGFEDYYANAPVTPADYEKEQEIYARDNLFEDRIETAIQRYVSRRKFHSDTKRVFDHFLTYGGIDCRPNQFTGSLNKEELENMDATQIAAAKAVHKVAWHVEHTDKWVVDFAGVARGYLSSATVLNILSGSAAEVSLFVKVLSNFYRYLIHHDVCTEFNNQIQDALDVCRIASVELVKAVEMCAVLPDRFNRACSALSGGNFAYLIQESDDEWGDFDTGLTRPDAEKLVASAINVLGTTDQKAALFEFKDKPMKFEIVSEQEMDLQVIEMQRSDSIAYLNLNENKENEKGMRPLGMLKCQQVTKTSMSSSNGSSDGIVTFWLEDQILDVCFVGMKMEVTVCENDLGCTWIERIRYINPSYFEVIANEFYDGEQDMDLPKLWYKRERAIKEKGYKKADDVDDMNGADEEDEAGTDGADDD